MRLARKMMGETIKDDVTGDTFLCVGPDWLDSECVDAWNGSQFAGDGLPAGTPFDRTVMYRYSARQLREEQPEHGDYWGEDGELQTFIVAAHPQAGEA